MKPIVFIGDSLEILRDLPKVTRQQIGFQLDKVQRGITPDNFKSLSGVGKGVYEIRIRDMSGIYRVIYIAMLKDAVHVLHVLKKKTQRIPKSDIELVKTRLASVIER